MAAFAKGFQWDPKKNESNLMKHGIDFEEATKSCMASTSFVVRNTHWRSAGSQSEKRTTA